MFIERLGCYVGIELPEHRPVSDDMTDPRNIEEWILGGGEETYSEWFGGLIWWLVGPKGGTGEIDPRPKPTPPPLKDIREGRIPRRPDLVPRPTLPPLKIVEI